MGGFIDAALGFPTVLFTPLLIIVVAYWAVVAVGGADPDDGFALVGGLPITIPISLIVTFAWFGSLAGAEFLPGWLALILALAAAVLLTMPAMVLIGRFTRNDPSRADFVGLTCIIRTG